MGKSKKKKKPVKRAGELTNDGTPRSFVFHRGEVGKTLMNLVGDIRHIMQPYTAVNLKTTKSNVLKDFVHVAGPYGISHFIIISKTELAPYMKICRLPRGPTLTFKLNEYSLMKDVVSILKRPKTIGQQFRNPSLAVLNGFNGEDLHIKLMTTVFQNMFPSLKVQKVKLSDIGRCSVFNYNPETGCVDFRHYNIEARPTGVSRCVKKLLKNQVPNLGTLNDISDFVSGAAYLSESEGEDVAESKVILPQKVRGRGNIKSGQSAIRLTEMGPRFQLELLKIEEGVCDGEVLYHKYESRTTEEVKKMKKKRENDRLLKEKRKQEQAANIAKKEKENEEHKQRSLAGMKRKNEDASDEEDNDDEEDEKMESDEDDDIAYYRQEVGEEPDKELFDAKPRTKKSSSIPMKKRRKMDTVNGEKATKLKNLGLNRERKSSFRKIQGKGQLKKSSKVSNVKFKPKKSSRK